MVNTAEFDTAMTEQKAKARAAWMGTGQISDEGIWFEIADDVQVTDFLGYDTDTSEAQLLALVKDGKKLNRLVR